MEPRPGFHEYLTAQQSFELEQPSEVLRVTQESDEELEDILELVDFPAESQSATTAALEIFGQEMLPQRAPAAAPKPPQN